MDTTTHRHHSNTDHRSQGQRHGTPVDPLLFLIVFIGGTLGTGIRYALSAIQPVGPAGSIHLATLIANIIACFFYSGIGTVLAAFPGMGARRQEAWSRGLCMGLCGGLSTMSTLVVEVVEASQAGATATTAGYLLMTFILGLLSAAGGIWIALHAISRMQVESPAFLESSQHDPAQNPDHAASEGRRS